MVQHPWHEVSVGTNPPEVVNAIIEIPRGMVFTLDQTCSKIMNDRHFNDFDDIEEGSILNKTLHIDESGRIVN